ncbi:transporter substrate-binding protein [Maridesulfovibrio sp.]|uniref:transporter substrate-binding protein n=1 Tax=Maridesulfovibrio sp. TaxID=2795000 RepID=UPI002AA7C604|nr:transporter substrate-binding protein [Maridesulfovibrio sp.]
MPSDIPIGILHSLDGPMASSERMLIDAALLAVNEINARGGLLGRQVRPYVGERLEEAADFGLEAEKLICNRGVRSLFGCWTSASRKKVKPVVEQEGSLLWYPVQYEGLEQSSNIVYTGSCMNQQIVPMIRWALSMGRKRIALIGSDYVFPRTANKLIASMLTKTDAAIVHESYHPLNCSDFHPVFDALSESRPDLIINSINGYGNISFFEQLQSFPSLTQPDLICSLSCCEILFSMLSYRPKGLLACWGYFQSLDTPANKLFLSKLEGIDYRISSDPLATAYSQVLLWASIVDRIGSCDPADILANLSGSAIDSPLGWLEIQANHHVSRSGYIGRYNESGQFDILWQSEKPIAPLPWLGVENADIPFKELVIQILSQVPEDVTLRSNLEAEIVSRKKLATELAESERKFKEIAKASPVGIIITDTYGNVQYANCRAVEMCSTTFDQMKKRGWTHFLEMKDKLLIFQKWFNAETLTENRLEFRIKRKEETDIWVLGQIVKMGNTQSEMSGFIITLTDINPIKEAELDHKLLSAVIDQAAEAILITDTSGIITYVNPAFETISGYSAKDVVGHNPSIIKSNEHEDSFYANMWESINRGQVWKGQIVNLGKNGSRFTQDTIIAPVRNDNGKIVNFVSVARDISQQLVIEAQLRQAQKLESIGELAAGIAHEINTPTQYVTTNVKFLEDSYPEILETLDRLNTIRNMGSENYSWEKVESIVADMMDEEDLKFLAEDIPNAIKESTEGLRRIADIVKSVKQLAHPGETQKSYHDLNGIIYDAVTVSTNEWKYVAEVEMELDENLPPLYCLKGEMGQVILNLIINSAHAIEQSSGHDKTDKGLILVKNYTEEDSIILKIKDTGCGMPEHVMKKAFDPFFTTKQIGKGTGQGLAIAYNVIVNIHNGSIVLDSKEGVGTTVTMTLPISK